MDWTLQAARKRWATRAARKQAGDLPASETDSNWRVASLAAFQACREAATAYSTPRGGLWSGYKEYQRNAKKCPRNMKRTQQIPKNTKQILNVMPRRPILLPEGDSDRVARVEAIDTTSANHHKSKSPQEQITTSANHHKRKSPQEQITTSGKNWGNQNLPWRTNFGFPRNTKISLLSRFLYFGRGIDLSKIC